LCRVERFLKRGFVWDPDYNYPYDREIAIIKYIQTDDNCILKFICDTLIKMDDAYVDMTKKRFAFNKLFSNIINAIYTKFDWLHLYLAKEEIIDTPAFAKNAAGLVPFFENLFNGLFVMQKNLALDISNYVLRNPENDLSLSVVARIFYYNPSYLSVRFKKLTGLHYNSYAVFVKLCRGDFLIRYKNLTVTDVSSRLTYTESQYFSTIYKKFVSPFANIISNSRSQNK
jgi:two-component system response regulator YesN